MHDQADGMFKLDYPSIKEKRTRQLKTLNSTKYANPTFAQIVCGDESEPMVYSHKGPTYSKGKEYSQQKEINEQFRNLRANSSNRTIDNFQKTVTELDTEFLSRSPIPSTNSKGNFVESQKKKDPALKTSHQIDTKKNSKTGYLFMRPNPALKPEFYRDECIENAEKYDHDLQEEWFKNADGYVSSITGDVFKVRACGTYKEPMVDSNRYGFHYKDDNGVIRQQHYISKKYRNEMNDYVQSPSHT